MIQSSKLKKWLGWSFKWDFSTKSSHLREQSKKYFSSDCARECICVKPNPGKVAKFLISSSPARNYPVEKRFYDSGKCQSRPEGSPLIYTFHLVHKTPCTLQPFMICKGGGWDFPIYSYHKRETNDQCSLVTTHCTLQEEFQPFVNVGIWHGLKMRFY